MPDLEQIVRAFETVDTSPPRRAVATGSEERNGMFSFTAGDKAKTFSASLSMSQRFYMTKKHKER